MSRLCQGAAFSKSPNRSGDRRSLTTASGSACPTKQCMFPAMQSVALPDLARLLFRQKLVGQACRWPKQFNPAGGKRPPYNLLAKPRIEVETAGIFNFDFAEIVMFRIKEKRSLSRHNDTRNGKNHGVTCANPIVANIFGNGTRRLGVPAFRQFL